MGVAHDGGWHVLWAALRRGVGSRLRLTLRVPSVPVRVSSGGTVSEVAVGLVVLAGAALAAVGFMVLSWLADQISAVSETVKTLVTRVRQLEADREVGR